MKMQTAILILISSAAALAWSRGIKMQSGLTSPRWATWRWFGNRRDAEEELSRL